MGGLRWRMFHIISFAISKVVRNMRLPFGKTVKDFLKIRMVFLEPLRELYVVGGVWCSESVGKKYSYEYPRKMLFTGNNCWKISSTHVFILIEKTLEPFGSTFNYKSSNIGFELLNNENITLRLSENHFPKCYRSINFRRRWFSFVFFDRHNVFIKVE